MTWKRDNEAENNSIVLAVKKAAGDKSVYDFITGSGVFISALSVVLIFTGVGLGVGIGMFVLGEVIAGVAAYVSHQSQKELDALELSQEDIKDILKVEPQVVIEEDDIKPQTTIDENANLSPKAKELEGDKSVYDAIKYVGIAVAALGILLAIVASATIVGLVIGLAMIAIGGAVAFGFDQLSRQAENALNALPQKEEEEVAKKRPQVVLNQSPTSQATVSKVNPSSDPIPSQQPSAAQGMGSSSK